MKLFKLVSVAVAVLMILAAVTPAFAQAPSQNIVEILSGDKRFTTLVAAASATDVAATLSGEGPFTVFAPTNAAFNKLGKSTIDALLADPDTLSGILLYHAVAGKNLAEDVVAETSFTTAQGQPVVVKMNKKAVFINNARVIQTDIEATNGVIHVIDAVLQPATMDIVDTLASRKNFSTLAAAVDAADLTSTLQGSGPFTVFAPTNAAFNKLGRATIDALLADPEALADILEYHVVSGQVYSGDAVKLTHAATVNGADVAFTMRSGGFYVNDARIVRTDILTTNGVIHVIDAVLQPATMDIVDTLASRKNFSTLVAAVEAAELTSTLKGSGPFTVFAPTNKAFNKLGSDTIEALLADPEALAEILQYHVVAGQVYSGDVVTLTTATTLYGEDVDISVKNGRVYINDARVTATNILTTNGVIHVIDTVLTPPAP